MKKSLTELSEKELLDIIGDDPGSLKVYSWPNDVMEFISIYNLKTGEHHVTNKLLYRLYRLWSNIPVTQRVFTTTLMDLFPSIQYGANKAILLDKNSLNLKQEAYNYVKVQDKTKYKGYLKLFEKYLHTYCIKKGSFFIKDSVLYKLYSKLCSTKRHPLGKAQFNNFCKLYFKNKLIKGHQWFAVDESIKEYLTEDLINEMSKTGAKQKKKQKI